MSLLALSLVQSAAEGLIEPLTGREIEVLALLAQRLTYKEIGAQLFISADTVSQHAVRIYQKLTGVEVESPACLIGDTFGIVGFVMIDFATVDGS